MKKIKTYPRSVFISKKINEFIPSDIGYDRKNILKHTVIF